MQQNKLIEKKFLMKEVKHLESEMKTKQSLLESTLQVAAEQEGLLLEKVKALVQEKAAIDE